MTYYILRIDDGARRAMTEYLAAMSRASHPMPTLNNVLSVRGGPDAVSELALTPAFVDYLRALPLGTPWHCDKNNMVWVNGVRTPLVRMDGEP